MIVFSIIALLLAITGFILLNAFAKDETDECSRKKILRVRNLVPVAIVGIWIVTVLLSGIKIIDATEVGVVKTFGKLNYTMSGGFHIVNPLTDTVDKYDLRVHIRTAEFATYTKDAQPVEVSVDYQYALHAGEVMEVAREYGTYDILETKLNAVVEEKVKTVFARYSGMALLENRANLSAEVLTALDPLEQLYHVNFTTAVINNLDFSDAFEASVEAKMTAEQEALRAEQEKKTAIVKAEQARETAKINAEAEVEAARGKAEAMRIEKEALNSMPETYIQKLYLERWNGVLPQTILGDSGVMVSIGQ